MSQIERIQGIGNQGPYAQGVRVGDWVYTSGQIPMVPTTGLVLTGPITIQAPQVFANLQAVLAECGADLTQVVKVTVYLTDLADFAQFNEVYAQVFATDRPARACVQVAALPRGVAVEVEAIAYTGRV
ncbi:Rid family detoxifying hydrolase [Candidatus Cyanaurora vandensis]|nr:Rid family detoxifying hydrolase [Candidatus Cyanaurora vandensis]